MPNYSVRPHQHVGRRCAFCGSPWDLVAMHVRNARRGGRTVVVGCRSCNSSMGNYTLVTWLRKLRDSSSERHQEMWEHILDNHWHRKTRLSQLIHNIARE